MDQESPSDLQSGVAMSTPQVGEVWLAQIGSYYYVGLVTKIDDDKVWAEWPPVEKSPRSDGVDYTWLSQSECVAEVAAPAR